MKRTTVIMILPIIWGLTVCLLTAFREKPKASIRFKTLTSTIKSDTSATIELLVDRGDYEEFVSVDCTLGDTALSFRASYHPNFRNVTVNYSGKLPLK